MAARRIEARRRVVRWTVSLCAAMAGATGAVPAAAGTVSEPGKPGSVSTAFTGPGFDACWAPDSSEMDAWLQSPYRGIGIYLGGPRYASGCRDANAANLTPEWVRRQAANGWRFAPIYVGSQAEYTIGPAAAPDAEPDAKPDVRTRPAAKAAGRAAVKAVPKAAAKPAVKAPAKAGAKAKAAKAAADADAAKDAAADPVLSDFDSQTVDSSYRLGVSEADDAAALARNLGFPRTSVIYDDMESYGHKYTQLVVSYSQGWTAELHRLGFRAGWYSSSGSGIADQVQARGPLSPDVLDIANWDDTTTTDDPVVPAAEWADHRRMRQTAGNHEETWGGVTITVDDDWFDVGPAARDTLEQLAGPDRDATAVEASARTFDCAGCTTAGRDRADSAVLSRDDAFADALAGSALAARDNGPLLLTPPGKLNAGTLAELHRILAPGATVYLLGGRTSLSAAVEKAVAADGFTPVRVAGPDRFATSTAVARAIAPDAPPSSVLVADGTDFPDALTAGAAAGATGAVVVLTSGSTMPAATLAYLSGLDPKTTKVYGIGAKAVAAVHTALPAWTDGTAFTPLTGKDRYATAAAVATQFFRLPTSTVVASGTDWADALSGSAMAAHWDAPLLLTDPKSMPNAAGAYLGSSANPIADVVVVGGRNAVAPAVLTALGNAFSSPGQWELAGGR